MQRPVPHLQIISITGQRKLTISVLDRYHLKDVIVGKIYFLLVRIKIKHMELSIIRRETTGSGELPTSLPLSAYLKIAENDFIMPC